MKKTPIASGVAGALPKEFKADNLQDWSGLENIYQTLANGILDTGDMINQTIAMVTSNISKEVLAEINVLINGLNSDLRELTDRLIKLHNKHSGCQGLVKNQDELMGLLSISEEYHVFSQLFTSVTYPVIYRLTELTTSALPSTPITKLPTEKREIVEALVGSPNAIPGQ